MLRDEDFDYRDEEGEPAYRSRGATGATEDRRAQQAARIQRALSNHFLNTMIRRKGADSENEDSEDEVEASGRGERLQSSATGRSGGLLGALVKQASKGALIRRFSTSSSSGPGGGGALDIKTVEMEVSESHRQLVRAVASQRNVLAAPENEHGLAGSTAPTAAPAAPPSKVFTLWFVGRAGSGRHSLLAGLLFFLQRRLGLGSNETLITHLQARFQEELPPASELSSATSLLVVVFDVCDRAGLEAVSTLPEAPWHKPLLVGNKVDQEYWRSIKVSHGESVAVLRGYDYHEASALTGLHVEDVLGAMDRRLKMVRALRLLDVDLPPDMDVERLSDSNHSGSSSHSSCSSSHRSSLTGSDMEEEEQEDGEDEASLYSAASSSCSLKGMKQAAGAGDEDDDEEAQAVPRSPSAGAFFDAQERSMSPDESGTPPVGLYATPPSSPRPPSAPAAPMVASEGSGTPRSNRSSKSRRGRKQSQASSPSVARDTGMEVQVVQDCDELFGPEVQGEEEEGEGRGARPGHQDDDKGIATTKTGDKAASHWDQGLLGLALTTMTTPKKKKKPLDHSPWRSKDKAAGRAAPAAADDLYDEAADGEGKRACSRACCKQVCHGLRWLASKAWRRQSHRVLFQGVLADMEAACRSLARLLARLLPAATQGRAVSTLLWWPVGWSLAYLVTLACWLPVLLPSFVTRLIFIRPISTAKPRNQGQAGGPVAAEQASSARAGGQGWRLLVRLVAWSLPMAVVLLVLPVLLVYRWLPAAPPAQQTAMLVAYLTGLLALQAVGSIRGYLSWRAREQPVPPAPRILLNSQDPIPDTHQHTILGGSLGLGASAKPPVQPPGALRLSRPPALPGSFPLWHASSLVVLLSLALESALMAAFALQADPYTRTGSMSGTSETHGGNVAGKLLHMGPVSHQGSEFWGQRVFSLLFLSVLPATTHRPALLGAWAAVAAVAVLLLAVAAHLAMELRAYGLMLLQPGQVSGAREWLFNSLTGSLLHGHGRPANVPVATRTLVSVLSDWLFLVVGSRLLHALTCDYSDADRGPRVLADPSMVCWEGSHRPLACACLLSLALYLPLSVLVAPMLTDSKAKGPTSERQGVAVARPHVMASTLIKAGLLLVASLGPRSLMATAVATAAASSLLCLLTTGWLAGFVPRHYSQELEPCSVALASVWKAASYAAGACTAVVLIVAHLLGPHYFPEASLLPILVIAWIGLMIGFAAYYLRWRVATSDRYATIERLLALPFDYHAALLEMQPEPTKAEDGQAAVATGEGGGGGVVVLAGMGDYDRLNKHGPPPAVPGFQCCALCQHRKSTQGLVMRM